MSGITRWIVLTAAMTTLALAGSAEANVTITKPVPNGGPVAVVCDGNPNISLGNSGHYATATNGPTPYTWALDPPSAGAIQVVPGTDTKVARLILFRGWAEAPGNDYGPVTLRVVDAAGTEDTETLHPVSLIFTEMGTSDRVVHKKTGRSEVDQNRIVKFEARGNVSVFKVFTHAYSVEQTPGGGTYGAGRIEVKEYDGDAQKVQSSGCSPPPGVQAPFGKWKLAPSTGVSTSWNANPPPGEPKGTIHEITIEGTSTSSFQDDIEWDIGIETGPSLHNCADGIGCVMLYTVVEVDLTCSGLSEQQEKTKGVFVAFEKGGSNDDSVAPFVMRKVLPTDLTGYELQAEALDTSWNPTADIKLADASKAEWSSPAERGVNSGLDYTAHVRAVKKSGSARDRRCRIRLRDDSEEVGDETCRDWMSVTSVEFDVINPVKESGGLTTSVTSATANGNEFCFDTSTSGVLDIEWRMKVLPDVTEVRDAYAGKMTWSLGGGISGSTLSWPNGQDLSYSSGDSRWASLARFTNLPSTNDVFGLKTCTLTISSPSGGDDVTAARPVEIFYNATATNHPSSTGEPNWFLYYRDALGGSYGYTSTGLSVTATTPTGDTAIKIGNEAYDGNRWLNTTTAAAGNMVINTSDVWSDTHEYYPMFCGIVAHERQHANNQVYTGPAGGDQDSDRLTATFETGTANTLDTHAKSADPTGVRPATTLDNEIYAGGPVEEAGVFDADPLKDWARPGGQWGQ